MLGCVLCLFLLNIVLLVTLVKFIDAVNSHADCITEHRDTINAQADVLSEIISTVNTHVDAINNTNNNFKQLVEDFNSLVDTYNSSVDLLLEVSNLSIEIGQRLYDNTEEFKDLEFLESLNGTIETFLKIEDREEEGEEEE